MRTLSNLLEKFTQSLGRDTLAKESVVACIKECLGFDILSEDVSVKGDILRIKASPAKKSEINMHEARILADIRLRCGLKLSKILYA